MKKASEHLLGGNPRGTWFFIRSLFYQPMTQVKVPSLLTPRLLPQTLLFGETLFWISHQAQLNRIKREIKAGRLMGLFVFISVTGFMFFLLLWVSQGWK